MRHAFATAAPSRSHSVRVCVGLFPQLGGRNTDCQDSHGRRDYNTAQAAALLHRALVNAPSVTVGALLWCLLPQGEAAARASSRQLQLAVTAHNCAVERTQSPQATHAGTMHFLLMANAMPVQIRMTEM